MIAKLLRDALEEALGDRVRFDHPLARCTSLRVGGLVDALVTPTTREEIARTLEISPKTVDHHLQRIYPKLGVSTRAGATLLAMERGYVAGRA